MDMFTLQMLFPLFSSFFQPDSKLDFTGHGKIHEGMSVGELFTDFGLPKTLEKEEFFSDPKGSRRAAYRNNSQSGFCANENWFCYVVISKEGKVLDFSNISPKYQGWVQSQANK